MTRAGVGGGHHRAGGYHIEVGVKEREAVGGRQEVLTRVVERRDLGAHLAPHRHTEGDGEVVGAVRPDVDAGPAALRAEAAAVCVAGQRLLHLPPLDQLAGGGGDRTESEALPGHVVEGVVGLFEASLQRLRHEDAGGQQGLRLREAAGLGPSHYPRIGPQLVHGEPLSGVDREEAFGQVLCLGGDTAPGLALQSEVALLDPPHHVAGAVRLQPGVEGRSPTQHGELKYWPRQ